MSTVAFLASGVAAAVALTGIGALPTATRKAPAATTPCGSRTSAIVATEARDPADACPPPSPNSHHGDSILQWNLRFGAAVACEATLRRHIVNVAAGPTRAVLHLPTHWPWACTESAVAQLYQSHPASPTTTMNRSHPTTAAKAQPGASQESLGRPATTRRLRSEMQTRTNRLHARQFHRRIDAQTSDTGSISLDGPLERVEPGAVPVCIPVGYLLDRFSSGGPVASARPTERHDAAWG